MFSLSIIIPLGDSVPRFETTLASVLQNRPVDCEVIAVHDGSYHDPYDLAGEVQFVEVRSAAGLAQLLNAGIDSATGEILHIVMDGVETEDGWTEPAVAHFADPKIASVSPVVIAADDRERIVSAGIKMGIGGSRRPCLAGDKLRPRKLARVRSAGPSIEAAFYRRAALATINGFEPKIGHSLDVDVAQSLSAIGFSSTVEPSSRMYAEPRDLTPIRPLVEGQIAQRLIWRHAPARGWLKSLLVQPVIITGDLLRCLTAPQKLTKILGRAVACCELIAYRRHHQMLSESQPQLHTTLKSDESNDPQDTDGDGISIRRAA